MRITSTPATTLNGATFPITYTGAQAGDTFVFDGSAFHAVPLPYFGDGIDGDLSVSGAATWARDMYFRDLTPIAGAAINPSGWRGFIDGVLDVVSAPTGAFVLNGADGGDAVTTGAGAAATTIASGLTWHASGVPAVGKAGGVAVGTAGTATVVGGVHYGGQGGTAGTGGTASAGAVAGGAPGATAVIFQTTLRFAPVFTLGQASAGRGGANGPTGGSGAGDGTAGGGSGGGPSGGASLFLAARTVLRSAANTNPGIVSLKAGRGGHGASPVAGNRGGGSGAAGGGGGFFYGLFGRLTGTTHVGAIDVSGGAGGNGAAGTGNGGAGTGAGAGFGGSSTVVDLSALTAATQIKVYNGQAVGGSAAIGSTGGVQVNARGDL